MDLDSHVKRLEKFRTDMLFLFPGGAEGFAKAVADKRAGRSPGDTLLPADEGLKTDGPTVQEYVAQGYLALNYPPVGFESRSTPEEIAAAIADQDVAEKAKAKVDADAKAKSDAEAKIAADAKTASDAKASAGTGTANTWAGDVTSASADKSGTDATKDQTG